jgi:hypothetical protein
MIKVKRTYNLRPRTVATVKQLAESRVAPSQDAVVDRAVRDMARRVRDLDHTRQWEEAAQDPSFRAEIRQLWYEFEGEDRAAWENGRG